MKLSRFSKQIIAVVCSIAMVIAGLAFVPSADTKADAPDWSTIDYLGDGAGGGTYTNKYKFYAENGTKAVNIQHPGFSEGSCPQSRAIERREALQPPSRPQTAFCGS